MLKKCISLAIVCVILAGLLVPAYAADSAKTYAEYVLTDNVPLNTSGFSTYVVTSSYIYNNFRPGNSLPSKTGDVVYEMSNTASASGRKDMILQKNNMSDIYTDGEKVHISTELMVPAGSVFDEYRIGGPGIAISAFTDADGTAANAIGVANPGRNKNENLGKIISFDHSNRITLFGGRIHSNMNWAYDQWYKIDVVIVMGDEPKAAIYVDGQPLAIDVNYGNGNPADNTNDATFDGIKTSTDYIDVGYRTAAGFVESGIYGISGFSVATLTPGTDGAKSTVYVDNLSYKAMSATDYPVIDSSLAIKGIADGATADRADLSAVEVNVPAWFADQTSKVTLSVDGAEAIEDTSAPFTFDLSTVERGVRHLTLTAYDANDNAIKQAVRTLIVAGNEEQTLFYNDFEASAPFNDTLLYGGSSPHYNDEMTDDRMTTFENVTDSAGTIKRAAKLYSKNTKEKDMCIGYKSATPTTGTVNVSYDMYLDNSNVDYLAFCRIENGYDVLRYADGKFITYLNTNYGLKSEVSFDAVIGYWQNWQWAFDFERQTVSLKVDGETKLDNIAMGADWFVRDCTGFRIYFRNSSTETGNFIAVDNFNVTRYTGIPDVEYDMYDYNNHKSWAEYTVDEMKSFGLSTTDKISVPVGDNSGIYAGKVMNSSGTAPLNESFGDSIIGEFSSNDAYTATACAIPFTYNRSQYHMNYGSMTVEYDFYLDNLNHNAIYLYFDSTSFARIKPGESLLRIDPWGNYNTGYNIIPGEWHRFKFVVDYNAGAIPYVGMYVDGEKVYYGTSGYAYAPLSLYYPSYFNWIMNPAADSTDPTKYAANKMAIDNICFSFDSSVPYISSVDFGDGNYSNGLVKSSATTATVKVSGIANNNTASKFYADQSIKLADVSSKISLVDVAAGTAVEGVAVSAAADSTVADVINVTLSDFVLESGRQYKILLDSGLAFDSLSYFTTNETSSFIFTAADSIPAVDSPDDGVAGSITVTDVRYTTNNPLPLASGALKGYTGGTIAANKELRADVMVNNASSEAQTFRVVIATYNGDELTGISLGEECTVLPNAQSMVFTSGKIDISAASAPDIKVMILTDSNTIVPVSKAFSIDN